MADVGLEQLSSLSPNMRKVLRETSASIPLRDSYWITLVAMVQRGLLDPHPTKARVYNLTVLGRHYKAALMV